LARPAFAKVPTSTVSASRGHKVYFPCLKPCPVYSQDGCQSRISLCGYSLLQRDFSYFVPLVIGLLGCNENTAVVAGDEILGLVRPEHYRSY